MFCPRCGKALQDGSMFCMACGAKIDYNENRPDGLYYQGAYEYTTYEYTKRKNRIVAFVVAIAVVAVAVIVFIALNSLEQGYREYPSVPDFGKVTQIQLQDKEYTRNGIIYYYENCTESHYVEYTNALIKSGFRRTYSDNSGDSLYEDYNKGKIEVNVFYYYGDIDIEITRY